MQCDEPWDHNSQDDRKDSHNPNENHLANIRMPGIFAPKKSHCDYVQQQMNKRWEDHRNELAVVEIADAVVDPNAVMVKLFYAAV